MHVEDEELFVDDDIKTVHAFTIITADAQGGDIDGQDRRPLVLTAQDAAVWLDADLPPEQADMLVRSVALESDAFDWHPVDGALSNVMQQGCAVALPIKLDV